jgi:hypothetical protein
MPRLNWKMRRSISVTARTGAFRRQVITSGSSPPSVTARLCARTSMISPVESHDCAWVMSTTTSGMSLPGRDPRRARSAAVCRFLRSSARRGRHGSGRHVLRTSRRATSAAVAGQAAARSLGPAGLRGSWPGRGHRRVQVFCCGTTRGGLGCVTPATRCLTCADRSSTGPGRCGGIALLCPDAHRNRRRMRQALSRNPLSGVRIQLWWMRCAAGPAAAWGDV